MKTKTFSSLQPDDLSQHMIKIKKDEAKELVSKVPKPSNVTEKNRNLHKISAQNNRFKVVNCTRTLDAVQNGDGDDKQAGNILSAVTILDVEKETRSSLSQESSTEQSRFNSDDKFVFDVYVPDSHNDRTSSDDLLDLEEVRLVNLEDLFYMMILTCLS